ncbi:MAG: hypothetical protein WC726_01445 [Parcubacteria group bacterium]|jgi:hypothetical protein
MKKKKANTGLTFGSHVDFKHLHPLNTPEIKALREKVDKLLKKYKGN